jgi:3-phenylpropionate/cinnamic acid dioxygenase small subunit
MRNDLMHLEQRLATLERQQARIQARHDIWETIARYARSIDDQRDEELAELLTDDVVLQTQPWTQRPLVGKAIALKAFRSYCRAFHCPRHFITNHQLSLSDDGTATGYANWFVVQAREAQSYCGWGSYEWAFRYEDGRWKISRMLIILECMTTLERGWGMLADRIVPFPPRERV